MVKRAGQTVSPHMVSQLAVAVSAVLGSTALHAQGIPSPEAAGFLEEIIVTSQKVEENIQTVPLSVTAVTGESLERFQSGIEPAPTPAPAAGPAGIAGEVEP